MKSQPIGLNFLRDLAEVVATQKRRKFTMWVVFGQCMVMLFQFKSLLQIENNFQQGKLAAPSLD
jgi:hypothetical protein